MKRDSGIECLRCALMFGICLLHAITCCGSPHAHTNPWLSGPLMACVDGFVFISGYYGINFRIKKLIGLYLTGLFCAIISVSIGRWMAPQVAPEKAVLVEIWSLSRSYWFLNAYIFLMLLAPIVNAACEWVFERYSRERLVAVFMPVMMLAFGWGFFASCRGLDLIVPRHPGVVAYSGVTLLGVYVAARIYRLLNLEERLPMKVVLACIVMLCIASRLEPLSVYSSPVMLILAAMFFTVFRRVRVPFSWGGGGSLFSVYLLQVNCYGVYMMETVEDILIGNGLSVLVSQFIVAVILFVGGLMLDLPRRLLWRSFR